MLKYQLMIDYIAALYRHWKKARKIRLERRQAEWDIHVIREKEDADPLLQEATVAHRARVAQESIKEIIDN